ncbi:hypothetical protein TrST_g7639 [Triparma strigata]|uniref:LMBR1-like membrane protein n=1 Tax=Triparma strigata TaxID=1606541 RepID=A0A9W7ANS2_9STRA|nr:hypothetical protein TrST_g7639 [Triparma strigata]
MTNIPDVPGAVAASFLLPLPFCFLFARSYANPASTPLPTLAVLIISYSLTTTACLLLPFDLSYTAANQSANNNYGNSTSTTSPPAYSAAISVGWKTTFWTTFILAWGVLPLLTDFIQSGYLTPKEKVKDALNKNMKFYVTAGGVGLVVIIGLLIFGDGANPFDFLMAAGNTYGLLLVVVLLGHGLVNLPRAFFAKANPQLLVTRRYLLASTLDSDLFEAVWSLQDIEEVVDSVLSRKSAQTHNPQASEYLTEIQFARESGVADLISSSDIESRRTKTDRFSLTRDSDTEGDLPLLDPGCELTVENLANLNASLKQRQMTLRQAVVCRDALVDEVQYYEALSSGTLPEPEPFRPNPDVNCAEIVLSRVDLFFAWIEYYWRIHLRRGACLAFGALATLLSVLVLWSELTMGFPVSLSPFGQMMAHTLHGTARPSYFLEMISLLPLVYISWCVYSSLLSVRLFSKYGLKSKKRSDGPALAFSASYLVRMQFPLCYNYLLFLRYNASESSAFTALMSNMDTIPLLGTSLSVYLPLFTVALCAATFFNVYARLLAKLGIEHDDAIIYGGDAEEYEMKIREGKALLRKATRTDDHQPSSNSSSSSNSNSNNRTYNKV